ncbi:MAG TPA: energy transducer TonB [Bacteroidia bacterium]|jgi:protein TonB|nr:energy transducer TonB [Bacteroidia bacterium]
MKQLVGFTIQVLMLLSRVCASCQETMLRTRQHLYPPSKEIYSVLKTDTTLMQGSYQRISSIRVDTGKGNHKPVYKDIALINGYYTKGKKDSLWTERYWSGKLKMQGTYSNGVRTGIWEFCPYNGKPQEKYDYTTREFVSHIPDPGEEGQIYSVLNGKDTVQAKLDRSPFFIGGAGYLVSILNEEINYPLNAKNRGVMGKVYIMFTISSSGVASDFKVIKGIGSGCDEEALRAVKLIATDWVPGVLNGQPVSVQYILSVSFKVAN